MPVQMKKMLNVLLTIFIFISFSIRTTANICTARNFNSLTSNIIPSGNVFDVLRPGGLILCARECMHRSRCKSFNYIETTKECQLIDDIFSGQGQNNTDVLHSDITSWPKDIAESCKNHVCSNQEICVPSTKISCLQIYQNVVQANNTTLIGYTFDRFNASTLSECIEACHIRSLCKSLNYNQSSKLCELNTATMLTGYRSYVNNQPGTFYSNIDQYSYTLPTECGQGCDNHSVCEIGTGCVLQYCPPPQAPYSDNHIIALFDQSVRLWKIGSNLNYRCENSYFPSTDWKCLVNGTWQTGSCKALKSCSELFNDCDNIYGNGTYIFKFPGTDNDILMMCNTLKPTNTYIPILSNLTYSRYTSICSTHKCGLTTYQAVRVIFGPTDVFFLPDFTFSNTYPESCSSAPLLDSYIPCANHCISHEPAEFMMDFRGTGLALPSFQGTTVNLEYYFNNQTIRGECLVCDDQCSVQGVRKALLASNTDINYYGTVSPRCKPRT